MKSHILIGILALAFITACKKDDDTPSPSSGANTNGGGGGGQVGAELITSWSPLVPYRDQEVIFTGGPFNTDITANSITAWGEPFEILAVTETQITARPGPNMDTAVPGYNSVIITSGNAVDTIPYVYWKRPFNLMFLEDNLDDIYSGAPARPGDRVSFRCISATPSGMSASINGQSIPTEITVDSSYYCIITFRIPVSMGVGTDESDLTTALLSATNGDGRTDTLTIGWAPTPDMEIFGLELVGGGSSFDLGDMNSQGQVLNFRVFGNYLHSGQGWTLTGPSGTVGTWGTGDYGNESFIVINPISLQVGYYVLSLNGTFHSYGFTLVD
ncbi:MAG: hypothetical protein JNJ91_01760 [Flavobacteriales bacterium]|nr:hypothetical protein [Flavobacteriales bacterium]